MNKERKINNVLTGGWPYDEHDTVLMVCDNNWRISLSVLRELNLSYSENDLYFDDPHIGGFGGPGGLEPIPYTLCVIIQQLAIGIAVKLAVDLIVSAIKQLIFKFKGKEKSIIVNVNYKNFEINICVNNSTTDDFLIQRVHQLILDGNEEPKEEEYPDAFG